MPTSTLGNNDFPEYVMGRTVPALVPGLTLLEDIEQSTLSFGHQSENVNEFGDRHVGDILYPTKGSEDGREFPQYPYNRFQP